MKIAPLLSLPLLATIVAGQEPAAQPEPAELSDLRGAFQQEIERVTEPINEQYLKALESLQTRFTSSNQLEEALIVREAIKTAKSQTSEHVRKILEIESPSGATPETATASPSGSADATAAALRTWKGNGEIFVEDGAEVLRIETHATESMKVEKSFDARIYPNGADFHLDYRSSDYAGTGMRLKVYYNARDFFYRTVPVVVEGDWQDYVYRVDPERYRGSSEIRLQIEILGGTGTIDFRNLEVTAR